MLAHAATEGPSEERIGTVTHFFPKAKAAVVKLEDGALHLGDTIHIVGHGVDFRERVKTLQLDHAPISEARAGQLVGVGVSKRAHENADVFIVRGDAAKPGFWARLFGR